MKQKALVMAEMQAFQNKRQEEDEILRNEIDDLLTAINKLVSVTFTTIEPFESFYTKRGRLKSFI